MTLNRRSRPVEITDAPEWRAIPMDRIQHRADDEDDNLFTVEGYASTFEEYDMYGGPANYGWIERIDTSAFDKTLREKPDLHFLINHAGTPLARTKSGTCKLEADEHGLKVVATLDKRDPESMGIFVKMERGDMDEMSFAFRVKAQEWRAADGFDDDNQSYRTITEVSLHKGDVSIVNWGANDTTSIGIRSAAEAVRFLAELDDEALAEVRGEVSGEWLQRIAGGLVGKPSITNITNNLHVTDVRGQEAGEGVEGEMEGDADAVRSWLDAERSWLAAQAAVPASERFLALEWLVAESSWAARTLMWLNAEREHVASIESTEAWLAAEQEFLSAKPVGASLNTVELARMQFNS